MSHVIMFSIVFLNTMFRVLSCVLVFKLTHVPFCITPVGVPASLTLLIFCICFHLNHWRIFIRLHLKKLELHWEAITKRCSTLVSKEQESVKGREIPRLVWRALSKSVSTIVSRKFLRLLDKHFPKRSEIRKLFNSSTVKVSYSTMPSMARIIKFHNTQVVNSDTGCDRPDVTNGPSGDSTDCNCRVKQSCPHNGRCLTESIVYRAEVRQAWNIMLKTYTGLMEGTKSCEQRYNNHLSTFRHKNTRTVPEFQNTSGKRRETMKSVMWSRRLYSKQSHTQTCRSAVICAQLRSWRLAMKTRASHLMKDQSLWASIARE